MDTLLVGLRDAAQCFAQLSEVVFVFPLRQTYMCQLVLVVLVLHEVALDLTGFAGRIGGLRTQGRGGVVHDEDRLRFKSLS